MVIQAKFTCKWIIKYRCIYVFFYLLKDSDEPSWEGCTNHSKLLVIAWVFTIKLDYDKSEAGYDNIIKWVKNILAEENRLKENFYAARFMMKPLGLGYQKFDICLNFCMLYYGEDVNLIDCKTCRYAQYKSNIVKEW